MTGLAPLQGPAGVAVARSRHPAARAGRPDVLVLAQRLTRRFSAAGVIAPLVAAATAATRGTWGVDRVRFARLLGVPIETIAAIEAGSVPLERVPAPLLVADPFPDVLAALVRHLHG